MSGSNLASVNQKIFEALCWLVGMEGAGGATLLPELCAANTEGRLHTLLYVETRSTTGTTTSGHIDLAAREKTQSRSELFHFNTRTETKYFS